jgi:hypothetical protein
MDSGALGEGPLNQTIFEATSNGGQAAVALKADVTWQPRLEVLPAGKLDFGAVIEGQDQSVVTIFTVRNAGGGALTGQLAAGVPWIRLDQDSFTLVSGAAVTVTATADPGWLGTLTAQEGIIHVTSSAGSVDKRAPVRVQKAWYLGWPRIRSWFIYGLLIVAGYLGAALPVSAGLAMLIGWQRPGVTILALLAVLLLLAPAAFWLSRRSVARLDEMEDYHHRGRLADDLLPSQFSVRKLAWLAGAGALLGGLLGWRFGGLRPHDATALWALAGAVAGALAGGLLAAEGGGGPTLSGRFWRGGTLATSPTYAILRSVLLALAGALLGLLAGGLVPPRGARLEIAVGGALLGLLMGSESHRWLSLRLRWLLMQARLGVWPIVGAYAALSILQLLRWKLPWTLLGYGHLEFRFTDLPDLVWLAAYLLVGLVGGLAGLWAAEGAGQSLVKAQRLFLGLAGIQLAAGLPVYVLFHLLTSSLRDPRLHMWINVAAVLAISIAAAWALRFRRVQVEMALARVGGALTAAWDRVVALLPGALRGAWRRLFGAAPSLGRVKGRVRLPSRIRLPGATTLDQWRAGLASLTLAELSAEMTMPLAIAATGVAVIVQYLLANFALMLIVGLGTLLLYALLVLAALVVIVVGVRYLRNR